LAYWWYVGRHWPVGNTSDLWGQFGDFLGGVVGTIVAAATLALVGVTILIQIRVMNLAKRQLEDSKTELALTRREMKDSNRALRQQTFEATFFRLLEQCREHASRIEHGGKTGPEAFSKMHDTLIGSFASRATNAELAADKSIALQCYERLYEEAGKWLGPYFRSIYHLHKLLHYSGLPEARRVQYASLVRAQLSRFELIILFYNLLSDKSFKMRSYVSFYGVLKHLDIHDLLDMSHAKIGFASDEAAFMDYQWRRDNGVMPASDIALPVKRRRSRSAE